MMHQSGLCRGANADVLVAVQVYDGEAYLCTDFPDNCGSLCTNHGRCVQVTRGAGQGGCGRTRSDCGRM
jgi:hypothetical protein